jgi:NTP pyrophosphatase (non-canonical NTP hydrolase)
MQLDMYQQQARATMHAGLSPRDALLDAAAGLAEEAAEVLSHVRKHSFFDRPFDKAAVLEELGDVLWCTAAVATLLGFSLGDVARHNLEKVAGRWSRNNQTDPPRTNTENNTD